MDEHETIANVFIVPAQEKPCWASLPSMIKLHHIPFDQYSSDATRNSKKKKNKKKTFTNTVCRLD